MKDKVIGIIYISILIFVVVFIYNLLDSKKVYTSNEYILKYLNNKFDYINVIKDEEIIDIKNFFKVSAINNFEYKNFKYNKVSNSVTPVINEQKNNKDNKSKNDKPLVYIYNTHNKEEYSFNKSDAYNITPTVITTSYILEEVLKNNGITSIVEERKPSDILKKNNWKYSYSYKASRSLLEDSIIKFPSLSYFIDIHRDSVKKSITSITIDGVDYAKVLFILGLENENYKENQIMIESLNEKINKKYPGLSRGIYKKQGAGVNGIYNQDFSPHCILIEFGGNNNTIDEVYNSVLVVGKMISEYIEEDYEDS